MRLPVRAVLAAVLSLLISAPLFVTPATASTTYTAASFAARLVELLNGTREEHGLVPLELASGTTSVAAAWSERLAADQKLSHNPDLQAQLESHGSKDWTELGENVGQSDTQDPEGLWQAYLASPDHRVNILEPKFRFVGNAVVFAGGRAWNTMDFVDAYATAKPVAKPGPTAAARVAPAPVATRPSVPAPRPTVASRQPSSRPTPVAVPRSTRSVPLPAPPVAAAPVAAVEVAAVALTPATPQVSVAPAVMDRARVLTLAIAAMLAMLVAALWCGLALPVRR